MDADVIIVGAGPAGSTCARLIAEKGQSVILLDKARFPRDKPCGGWVNRKAFETFPELESMRRKSTSRKRLVETSLHGLVFHSPDAAREATYTSRAAVGYAVLRKDFDARLVKAAADNAKVQFLPNREVTKIDVGEGGVTVATARGKRLQGRMLVGADGVNSTVARMTGLTEGWPAERLVRCLVKEVPVATRTIDRLYGKQRRLHVSITYGGLAGYAWAFPKRASVNVGIGCRGDVSADLADVFARWTADLVRKNLLPEKSDSGNPVAAVEPAGGAIDYEGHVGKWTVLIGDAGGFVSAATGEGIYPAMLSAQAAAECIVGALKSNRPQDALLEFKFAWRRRFAEYIQMPNLNLSFLLPLIYDNQELCNRFANCYLFGDNF